MINIEEANRWVLFKEEYKDFEPAEISDFLDVLQEHYLPIFFGVDRSDRMICSELDDMGVVYENPAMIEISHEGMARLPIYDHMLALNAYAYYGLIDREAIYTIYNIYYPGDESLDNITLVKALVEYFVLLFESDNQLIGYINETGMKKALSAAKARLKIDTMEKRGVVFPPDLAALVGLGLQSIHNLMAPGKALYSGNKGAGIPVNLVDKWLKNRKNYRQSLMELSPNNDKSNDIKSQSTLLQDVHFVPVAADGSWFSPQHSKEGLYQVGSRQDENGFEDYLSALHMLTQMEVPSWRRPTEKGSWTITVGIDWIRKTGKELGLAGKEKIS